MGVTGVRWPRTPKGAQRELRAWMASPTQGLPGRVPGAQAGGLNHAGQRERSGQGARAEAQQLPDPGHGAQGVALSVRCLASEDATGVSDPLIHLSRDLSPRLERGGHNGRAASGGLVGGNRRTQPASGRPPHRPTAPRVPSGRESRQAAE